MNYKRALGATAAYLATPYVCHPCVSKVAWSRGEISAGRNGIENRSLLSLESRGEREGGRKPSTSQEHILPEAEPLKDFRRERPPFSKYPFKLSLMPTGFGLYWIAKFVEGGREKTHHLCSSGGSETKVQ